MATINTLNQDTILKTRIPIVEIFETIEGEGIRAGFPTIFVRIFGCNLRCTWCDTSYSYPPHEPQDTISIFEIIAQIKLFSSRHLCLTGGEPLMYGEKSTALIHAISQLEQIDDIHIETNGAISLEPFIEAIVSSKVRYIMDVKCPDSGEMQKMNMHNISLLRRQDEIKFVIASQRDFDFAVNVLQQYSTKATPLFSPVWDQMSPSQLAKMILASGLSHVRLNIQLHKIIWDPHQRGV